MYYILCTNPNSKYMYVVDTRPRVSKAYVFMYIFIYIVHNVTHVLHYKCSYFSYRSMHLQIGQQERDMKMKISMTI